jgi:ribonuclease T1
MDLRRIRARFGSARGVAVAALAAVVVATLGTIAVQARAFRYEKDGSVFGNRERLLPGEKRGYYREYTVPTPGLDHRGARRIVCGGFQPRAPEACYYTEDHYSSFRLIVQ